MKTPLFRFTLYAIIVYLTGFTLTPAIAASQPSAENGTHLCGVIDYQPRFHRSWTLGTEASKQPDNRRYARTFAANLNVGEPYTVRMIYFLPSDRQPQPDIDTQMDKLIKDVQQVFARGMEQHGFGRKTFTFEADTTGKAVVHHVNGQFTAKYYYEIIGLIGLRGGFDEITKEIYEQFDTSRNIYLVIVDIDNFGGIATLGMGMGGIALVGYNAEFHGFRVLSVHELRHTFGFGHSNQYITSIGRLEPSKCTAEFLDVHRFFNATPQSQKFHNNTTIEMLSPSFAAPPDAIRVRFEVADPDGLHQARLHAPEVGTDGGFLACKRLTGTRSVVEFVTTVLLPRTRFVSLQVIDVHGNISWSGNQPIDVTSLLPPDKMVSIPDANLASAVREALDLAPGTALTSHAILDLTEFSAPNSGITDLTGLEHAHNLRYLHLANTTVSDVSPLSALTQLRHLHLANTAVSDVSPLSALTQLRDLHLANTAVSDVSPLSALTQLIFLYLNNTAVSDVSPLSALTQLIQLHLANTAVSDVSPLSALTQLPVLVLANNSISDISALAGLTQLNTLWLHNNSISDISALSGLTQLNTLRLYNNSISDVSPLLALNLTGTSWDSTGLYLEVNPLSYASIHTHIPAIQAKGIEVKFDNRTPTTLVKISGTEQQATVNAVLARPFVVEVRDEQNRAFSGVPVTFAVTAGGGKLSATTATTDLTGRAQARLTLGQTAGAVTVRVAAAEISEPVRFTATALLLSSPVTVPDVALRAKIAETLGKPPSGSLTVADMLTLATLTANNANIRELTGLQHASNLTTLSLDNNNLSDVSPLAGLPQLTTLSLDNNTLSDVALLTTLPQLTTLSLDNNTLSDVAPLTALLQLKAVNLRGNPLSYPSLHTHIPAIQAGGAVVAVDFRTPTTLLKIPGTHGVAGTALPVVVEVQDEKGLGFSGVPVAFAVTAGGGHLSAYTAITDITGRARVTLTLGGTPGKNTVRASAAAVSQPINFTITAIDASSPVTIPDAALHAKIAETLGKPVGVQLTAGEMITLPHLDARNANIQDLTGLEYAHNLKWLNLGGDWVSGKGNVNSNAVSNFSPLLGLTQLNTLNLSNNNISDISALAGLTQLTRLYLDKNAISDVSALAGLTQLTYLHLYNNSISDVSPLAGLTQLTDLYLGDNSLSDVSALAGLTQLTTLYLSYNAISDVSPLLALNLTGTSWDSTGLYLEVNPLSYASIHTHIPAMRAKGIEVKFDPRTHRALLKISGDNQKGVSFAPLSNPFVVEAQDENGSLLEGISVTFDVTAGGGTLSVTSTITDENGRAQSTLTLGPNLGTNTVEVSATGIEVTAIFNAIANSESPLIPADVNDDGSVNILDLVSVASEFGSEKPKLAADVNGDGIINILDLILVAGMFEGAAAGPAAHPQVSEALTAVEVQGWLTDASSLEAKDPIMKRGFLILKQLLASLTPTETELLANYPNPFNPETWMPYRLAEDAFVTLTIYDGAGQVVRTLDVGHQIAAVYENRSKAIYWDGRNEIGEQVASGVYFYHLSAGDYSATRKMVILK